MLVVEPSTLRFEEGAASGSEREAALLERLTILESHLTRFAEKLQQAFDLMLKQTQNIYDSQLLLQCLVTLLDESNLVKHERLRQLWRQKMEEEAAAQQVRSQCEKLREQVLRAHTEDDAGAFGALIEEGLARLVSGDIVRGIKALEESLLRSPDNGPLLAFLGEHFFREGKIALATSYLARAHTRKKNDSRTSLLLGLALADEGAPIEEARAHLREALKFGSSFAARYALGRLSALAGDWGAAAAEFKQALAARPCAEAHYVLALAEYQRGRHRLALSHARKAVELDENYGEAFYLVGLVRRSLGESAAAREAFAHARFLDRDSEMKPRARATRPSGAALLRSFFGAAPYGGRRLLTAGDARLARLLREDALAFSGATR